MRICSGGAWWRWWNGAAATLDAVTASFCALLASVQNQLAELKANRDEPGQGPNQAWIVARFILDRSSPVRRAARWLGCSSRRACAWPSCGGPQPPRLGGSTAAFSEKSEAFSRFRQGSRPRLTSQGVAQSDIVSGAREYHGPGVADGPRADTRRIFIRRPRGPGPSALEIPDVLKADQRG